MKKILSLQKLSMAMSGGNGGGDGGSRLSVTGCPGQSSLSLITCN